LGPLIAAVVGLSVLSLALPQAAGLQPGTAQAAASATERQTLLRRYCFGCHNDRLETGGLSLEALDLTNVGAHPDVWERVVRKLRGGLMPPIGRPRPSEAINDSFTSFLETSLDQAAAVQPNPGRTEILHRLNRAEYRNAIRDLLSLELDVADFLPADDSSYGFDNIAGVLRMSQALMERYLTAARVISRMAVGSPPPAVDSAVYRIASDMPRQDRQAGLPFGTRGGLLVDHFFPQDAEYDIKVAVSGARGIREPEQLEISIDGEQVQLFMLGPPESGAGAASYVQPNANNEVRVAVAAGPRSVGVTFFKNPIALVEQVRNVFDSPGVMGNPGIGGTMPSVSSVTITGPYNASGSGSTPSRDRVFVCRPSSPAEEGPCAKTIVSGLARRAYRGFVTDAKVELLLQFYRVARAEGGGFEDGIERAINRLLISPEFLYRIEVAPETDAASQVYRISDLSLASRLSFFLWSSIPDEELLSLAEEGRLSDPAVLERQVGRLLGDPRSESLSRNFAGQWLQLRNLEAVVRPGDPYSLAFDEGLRQGLLHETELFIDSIVRENRSLVEILTANYTFLNERVARHYEIPNIQGSHFRRVTLPVDSARRGLLGHGSVLTVTSHAIRTSPVKRGKWILENVLGTPPPDPPPNVPALDDKKTSAKVASLRERMSTHRANPVCASCHNVIDPTGFALENFDAIGRWRAVDESFNVIDASGVLPDGTAFDSVTEMTDALVRRPERFVKTVTEKLLIYALGRGLESYDMPALRKIVADAAPDDYRVHAIVLGIVNSYPFLNRDGTRVVDTEKAVAP
jgi:hypothetical protein